MRKTADSQIIAQELSTKFVSKPEHFALASGSPRSKKLSGQSHGRKSNQSDDLWVAFGEAPQQGMTRHNVNYREALLPMSDCKDLFLDKSIF